MNKLEDLQVGDEVIINNLTYKNIGIVSRTTKRCVEVKCGDRNQMYNKKDGKQKGCSGYCVPYIVVATEELKTEVIELNKRNKYLSNIRAFIMSKLSTDKLEQIYNIIKSKEK